MLIFPARIDFTSVPFNSIPASNFSEIWKSRRAFLLVAISLIDWPHFWAVEPSPDSCLAARIGAEEKTGKFCHASSEGGN